MRPPEAFGARLGSCRDRSAASSAVRGLARLASIARAVDLLDELGDLAEHLTLVVADPSRARRARRLEVPAVDQRRTTRLVLDEGTEERGMAG